MREIAAAISARRAPAYNNAMTRRRLYVLLQPESPDNGARLFRAVHHLMVAAGIAILLTATVAKMARRDCGRIDTRRMLSGGLRKEGVL